MGVHYYIDELNKAIPITDIMKRYGLDVNTRYNVHCPSPYHSDDKPSAKIYVKSNICRCFACSKSFTPVTIVMEQEGLSLPNACKTLIKEYGLNLRDYADIDDKDNTDISMSERFPLTLKELNLIHWEMGNKNIRIPIDEEGKHTTYYEIKGLPTLRDYYKDNPKAFFGTLQDKCVAELHRQMNLWTLYEQSVQFSLITLRKDLGVTVEIATALRQNYDKYKENGLLSKKNPLSKKQEQILWTFHNYQEDLEAYQNCIKTVHQIEKIARKVPIRLRYDGLISLCNEMEKCMRNGFDDLSLINDPTPEQVSVWELQGVANFNDTPVQETDYEQEMEL